MTVKNIQTTINSFMWNTMPMQAQTMLVGTLIKEGHTVKEIAEAFAIKISTVKRRLKTFNIQIKGNKDNEQI